ncbi:hypothetical protein GEV33_011577 [Tenebrio molitor]|uniref:Microtubule-associated protein futsch n=1 Tax=Tenebrio molitor TaxID=7067 RepID=A0A8J6HBG8_TENMO|nr:hypothetical protein GEV33_011577 [Tenebrio molitor]
MDDRRLTAVFQIPSFWSFTLMSSLTTELEETKCAALAHHLRHFDAEHMNAKRSQRQEAAARWVAYARLETARPLSWVKILAAIPRHSFKPAISWPNKIVCDRSQPEIRRMRASKLSPLSDPASKALSPSRCPTSHPESAEWGCCLSGGVGALLLLHSAPPAGIRESSGLRPLTGCYLLIVVGEPHCNEHKDIILQRVAKDLHVLNPPPPVFSENGINQNVFEKSCAPSRDLVRVDEGHIDGAHEFLDQYNAIHPLPEFAIFLDGCWAEIGEDGSRLDVQANCLKTHSNTGAGFNMNGLINNPRVLRRCSMATVLSRLFECDCLNKNHPVLSLLNMHDVNPESENKYLMSMCNGEVNKLHLPIPAFKCFMDSFQLDPDETLPRKVRKKTAFTTVIQNGASENPAKYDIEEKKCGLLSWDVNDCLVDLAKELAIITEQALEGEEARYGERLIQFASENLVTEILIHPVVSTLAQCVRNLLSSFTRHRHIIHAGYTFANNGSWVLQDGTFSLADFSEAFQEIEVLRVIRAYENGISLDIHCAPEGDWTRLPKEPFTKSCKVRVNPNDVLTAGSPSISSFINYLEPFLIPAELENILESSDVVGNIRFSRPTLYVFPGGQGDAALFGINGFNMLLDGGFSRKACFWDFVRHLDRLDAVLLTRLNNSNVNGISAVLRRKRQNAVYPQIGHFFCNIQERKAILSPDGDKDKDPLLINLLDEGQEIVSNLRQLSLIPQVCYRDSEPINLYHKVGHGTLDMYVLSPAKDSKEVREFLQKWNNNDQKLFANQKTSKDFVFPLQNLASVCALLVWQPANPEDTITRILFPGSSPQNKIFEGLDRIKSLEFIKHPVCSEKSLAPTTIIKTKQSMLEKIIQPEKKIPVDNKKEKTPKPQADNIMETEMKNGEVNGVQPEKVAPVKKSDSTESEKSISKPKKIIENGEKIEKPRPKPRTELRPKARSDSQQRKVKTAEKKPSPTTPKKQVNGEPRMKPKASPTATPAKSAKDANNRKVVESKIKAAPKKEPAKPIVEKKEVKTERKPISRRPKDISKLSGSPAKKVNGVQKPDSISRRGKLDKEGTTDSSTVSTPSADQDSILKKDISKLTTDEIQNLKAQELADLKEEQEAVKEIEAVFRKGELHEDKPSDFRKIKDLSIDDKLENEEYLIIEKTEIEQDLGNETNKEEETQKIARDSEESEKQRKLSGEMPSKETAVEDKRTEIQDEVQKIITSATDIVKSKDEVVEASKEVSVNSPEDKMDVSTDKKDIDNEIKEIAQESQPDEKGSANIESGATTTAPTLPEDERMPLDEIKEDNGDQIIEEKHVKEDTKEKDVPVIQLPPKTFENIAKLPPVVGIRLDKQSHIRDIVKTPDEVADLPVHEEVDYEYPTPTEIKQEPEELKKEEKEKVDVKEEKEIETQTKVDSQVDKTKVIVGDDKKVKDEVVEKIDNVEVTEKAVDTGKTDVDVKEEEMKVKTKVEEEKQTEQVKTEETIRKESVKEVTEEVKTVISEDLHKKELSKSPYEEKDRDEHEVEKQKEEVKDVEQVETKKDDKDVKDQQEIGKKEQEVKDIQLPETIKDEKQVVEAGDEVEMKKEEVQETKLPPPIEAVEKEVIKEEKKDAAKKEEIASAAKDAVVEKMPEEPVKPDESAVVSKLEEEIKAEIEKDVHKVEKEEEKEVKGKEDQDKKEEVVEKSETEVKEKDDLKPKDIEDEKLESLKEKLPDVPKDEVIIEKPTENVPESIEEQIKEDVTTIKKIDEKLQQLKDDTKEVEETDGKKVEEQIIQPGKEEVELVKEDVATIQKINEKLEKLKEDVEEEHIKAISEVVTHKAEEPQHAEPVIITTDSLPESPVVDERQIDDKMELGRKSPKEREEDVIKIVASVAEVLKSDAPLEEFEGKIPFTIPYKSYTTELRETHITTVESPVTDEDKTIKSVDEPVCPKASSIYLIEEERKIAPIHEEQEVSESKISKMMKESNELMQATSKMIHEIKQTQPKADSIAEETIKEEQDADSGTVHRMLVTTSSEDGGEEIEICPPGTITFSRSSESSGRSSPDLQSQKFSQKSSIADTCSEATVITKSMAKELQSSLQDTADKIEDSQKRDLKDEIKEVKDSEPVIEKSVCDTEKITEKGDIVNQESLEKTVEDKVVKEVSEPHVDEKISEEKQSSIKSNEEALKGDVTKIDEKEFESKTEKMIDDATTDTEKPKKEVEDIEVASTKVTDEEETKKDVTQKADDVEKPATDVKVPVEEITRKEIASSEQVGDAKKMPETTLKEDDIKHEEDISKDKEGIDVKTKVEDIEKVEEKAEVKTSQVETVKEIKETVTKEVDVALESAKEKIKPIEEVVESKVKEVKEDVVEKTSFLGGLVNDIGASLVSDISRVIDDAQKEIKDIKEGAQAKIEELKEDMTAKKETLVNAVEDFKESFTKDSSEVLKNTKDGVKEATEVIKSKVDEVKEVAAEKKDKVLEAAKDFEEAVVKDTDKVTEQVKEEIKETKAVVESRVGELKGILSDQKDTAIGVVSDVKDTVSKHVEAKIEEVKENIDDTKEKAKSEVDDVCKEVTKKIDEKIADLKKDVADDSKQALDESKRLLEEAKDEITEKASAQIKDIESKAETAVKELKAKEDDIKQTIVEETKQLEDKFAEKKEEAVEKLDELNKDLTKAKDNLKDVLETVSESPFVKKDVTQSEAGKASEKGEGSTENKYDLYNGLESVEKMVTDVLTVDRKDASSKSETDTKVEDTKVVSSVTDKIDSDAVFALEKGVAEIKELMEQTKGAITSIVKTDSEKEEVLEKAAHDIEENYKVMSDMTKSVTFEKCDNIMEEEHKQQEDVLEKSAQSLGENYDTVTDMARSIVFEKCEKPISEGKVDENILEKSAQDIEDNYKIVSDMAKSVVFEHCEIPGRDKLKDEKSVKSDEKSETTKRQEKSEISSIESKEILKEKEEPEVSATVKSIPDKGEKVSEEKHEECKLPLTDGAKKQVEEKEVDQAKKSVEESVAVAEEAKKVEQSPAKSSGKSSPDKLETVDVHEDIASKLSGKSSPALSTDLKDLAKEESGKSTPDIKDTDHIKVDNQDSLLSGKSSPGLSGKSSPILSGRSSPGAKAESKDSLLSGKSTPEHTKPDSKDSSLSEKMSPALSGDIKFDEKEKLEAKDSFSVKSSPAVSGKSSPVLSSDVKETEMDKSGKLSPDLKGDESESLTEKTEKEVKETKVESSEKAKEPLVSEKVISETKSEVDSHQKGETEKISSDKFAPEPFLMCALPKDPELSQKKPEEIKDEKTEKTGEKDAKVIEPLPTVIKPDVHKESVEDLKKSAQEIKEISAKGPDIPFEASSVIPEKKTETEKEKTETEDLRKKSLEVQEASEKKLSISDVQITVKAPEEEKAAEKDTGSPEDKQPDDKAETKDLDSIDSGIGTEKQQVEEKVGSSAAKTTEVKDESTDKVSIPEIKATEVAEKSVTASEKDEKAGKTSEPKEESKAGPSTTTHDTSLTPAKTSTEDLHLSGKSTPDIAEVEKLKEIQETLKHEKHIPGSSTPPTVPVSPIVKDISTTQAEDVKTSSSTPVKTSTIASIKDSEIRSCTPGSDDYEIGASTYSDISSGQVSRAPHLLESERIESDDDDDVPGSPMSVTSQVAHSRSSSRYDFEDDRIGTKMDPMNTSFYGALPDEAEPELEFEKAMVEHRQTRGEDLVTEDPSSYLYEITKAKFSSGTPEPENLPGQSQLDQINKNGSSNLMTASFMGELPSSTTSTDPKKDAFDSWGKPLGLPSPAPPNDNRGTPKKERKLPSNVSVKNKLNDDKKRSESPSKYKNKKFNPVYVDLTYVPHHGNAYYSYVDFFKRVRARYYVFSGIEPSREVYNALLEAKQTWDDKELEWEEEEVNVLICAFAEVTIIPTYDTDILGYWVAENEELLTKYKIDLSPSASRCTINLQDHETSCSAYRLEF